MYSATPIKPSQISSVPCDECQELLDAFGDAVTTLVTLHRRHFRAVVEDEANPHRFDLLIHDANERKLNAKYAYLLHRETHHCSANIDETDRDRA